jgi:hypothetical protein
LIRYGSTLKQRLSAVVAENLLAKNHKSLEGMFSKAQADKTKARYRTLLPVPNQIASTLDEQQPRDDSGAAAAAAPIADDSVHFDAQSKPIWHFR